VTGPDNIPVILVRLFWQRRRAFKQFRAAVISSTRNPVSAKQKLSLLPSRGWLVVCFLVGFFFACPVSSKADSLEDAVRALARRVGVTSRGGSVTLEQKNYSQLGDEQISRLGTAFQDELRLRGVQISEHEPASKLVLTISENITGLFAVVELQRGADSEILVEPLGKVSGGKEFPANASVTLHRELLLEEDDPVLDVLLPYPEIMPDVLLVLGEGQVHSYKLEQGGWVRQPGASRFVRKSLEREAHGRLFQSVDTTTVAFFDEACRTSLLPGRGMECEPKVHSPPGASCGPDHCEETAPLNWFSRTMIEDSGQLATIYAGTDGLARLYWDEGPEVVETFAGWGSEIAGVHSACGSGWQILTTGTSDRSTADFIRPVEIREHKSIVVGPGVEFDGPILSLHAQPGARSAIAVVHNLATGTYEAYKLTIACAP